MELLDHLLRKTTDLLATRRRLPESTYRLQFHAGFTFRDARRLVPYLRDLGVTHCYASPYLKARPGSTHGYDITDHRALNPEIGSEEDYDAWVAALRDHGLGQILDVVPNHMAVATNDNAWWNDVLENGPASRYAGHFDIAWRASLRPELQDKVLLPVLGEPYGDVLEKGQLRLAFEAGAFTIAYYDRRFPVAPCSYALVLGHRLEELQQTLGAESDALTEYQSILTAIGHLPERSAADPAKVAERQREKEVVKRRLAALAEASAPVREFIEANVARFSGTPGDAHSFDLLDGLLNRQSYRLSDWRVAADEINYRRFFDINDLAALSTEHEDVFLAAHELVLRLLREGKLDGLRVDHPDGLYDPHQYFRRLQVGGFLACAREVFETDPQFQGLIWEELEPALRERWRDAGGPWPLYVVAEKILGTGEPLPPEWAVYGTSGYEFLNMVNGLFVDPAGAEPLTRFYEGWVRDYTGFAEIVHAKKLLILQVALSSELHMLAHQLDRLAQQQRRSRDFTFHSLRRALREVIACFPVYRSYISDDGVRDADRRWVETAIRRARVRNPLTSPRLFRFVRDMLLLKFPESATEDDHAEQRRFAGKFQQVTAPVMAKGVEDTAFYVYNRLLSLNEVGGDPDRFGAAPADLHRYLAGRRDTWPHALSPLSTHDTKRSEDVRARLNVLSELPEEWAACVARWSRLNAPHRVSLDDLAAPAPNDEYLLYQTLVGAWPLEPHGETEYAAFVGRIQEYLTKALHEAKVHTSWINPNEAYDAAVREFAARILDEGTGQPFLRDFRVFQRRISSYGLFNALSQTLLRLTAPGVPDTYQGTELWDFSLVDPDNRRPVEYECRRRLLRELRAGAEAANNLHDFARGLTEAREDGRVKLYVTYRALHCRCAHPGLFSAGEYLPVETVGGRREQIFAFARRRGADCALVAVPRLLTRLVPDVCRPPLGADVWQDTQLLLPTSADGPRWRNVFTGEVLTPADPSGPTALSAVEVFAHFPIALLLAEGSLGLLAHGRSGH